MLSRPTFSIRKLIPSPQKKQDGPTDYEGSYFYHDNDEMDTLSKIKNWRPPMGLRRSKPSLDIRGSEDLHRIICIPPLPDTPQSSTTSLCSIDNGTGLSATASPRSSPPRRPDRSPLASPLMSPQRSPQRSPERSPLLLPHQFEDQQRSRSRSPVSARALQRHTQLTPPSSPPHQIEMVLETPVSPPDTVPSTPATATSSQPVSPETIMVMTPPAETLAGPSHALFSQEIKLVVSDADDTSSQLQQVVSNAKLSDHELDRFPKPKNASPASPPMRRKSQRRSQGSVKSVKSPTKASMKDPLSPAQARLPSNSRPKRAKSKKARRRPRAPDRQSSMWQLTESAKDLFTIRIFHRVEVDEMLPESTLREIRMSRSAHWTRSPELGVTHVNNKSGAAAAPVEPLSLDEPAAATEEDVVTPRASVAPQETELGQEDCQTPTGPLQLRLTHGTEGFDVQAQTQEAGQEGSLPLQLPDSPTTKSYNGDDDDDGALPIMMTVEDGSAGQAVLAPSPLPPPMKSSPMHRRLPSRQLPPLPTIPEIVTTVPEETAPPGSASSSSKAHSDDYVFLRSSAYSLTMPAFRHGQIRLAKADLPICQLAAAVDDTLDWTAFQMAILGGAGDFFSEPTDYSRPSETELDELEELVSWFGSFGFQGSGSLIGPSQPRTPSQPWTPVLLRTPALSPSSPTSTPNSSPRTVGSSPSNTNTTTTTTFTSRSPGIRRIDPPAPSEPKSKAALALSDSIAGRFFPTTPSLHPPRASARQHHRRSASSTTFGQPPPMPKQQQQPLTASPSALCSASFGRQRNHANLAIDSARRPSVDSIQSLPQSPMMDLVVSHDVEGNEYVVPMGFNLSHDLGDFLNWHAEHVSGVGFAAADGGGRV